MNIVIRIANIATQKHITVTTTKDSNTLVKVYDISALVLEEEA